MKDNFFLIHGSYGNPYKNFLPYLKKELSKRRYNVIVPNFPTPYKQDFESWSKILKAYFEIGYINEDTTFITHSLGGIFIIKFVIQNKIKIKKLITISGFNNLKFDDDINLYNTFYMNNDDLSQINLYIKDIVSFYSDNDPYVPLKASETFINLINSKGVLISGAGHFNEKSGYKEFHELLNYIK